MCTYNSEKILKKTLTCLNNSMNNLKNLNNIELIIVNNNSDDNTRKIAFDYFQVKKLLNFFLYYYNYSHLLLILDVQ